MVSRILELSRIFLTNSLEIHNLAYPIYYLVDLFKNHLKLIRKFLEARKNLHKLSCPMARWLVLCIAIFYEDFQIAKKMIICSVKVAQESLEAAILTENMKMVKLILQFVADPTPGLLVAVKKKSKLITLLLDAGANADDNDIRSAIVSGAQEGGNEEFWLQTIICFVEHGLDLNRPDHEGKSLLHLAYYPQNLHLLRALLSCGADVNTEDQSGRTVVSYHLEIRTSRMDLEVLRNIILGHLRVRLSVPGFELSRTNEELYKTILEEENLLQMYEVNRNEQECLSQDLTTINTNNELEKMRRMRFGGYASLYQMFRQPETVMVWCLENPELRNLLGTSRLEEDFPLCSCLLRMQYAKALKRKRLLGPATSTLDRLVFGEFEEARGGETCIRIIVDYLDNNDLHNLAAVF